MEVGWQDGVGLYDCFDSTCEYIHWLVSSYLLLAYV